MFNDRATSPAQELCRVKKAVKDLIRQHQQGIAYREICRKLQQEAIFLGTYRNLRSQVSAALSLLAAEGSIKEVAQKWTVDFERNGVAGR